MFLFLGDTMKAPEFTVNLNRRRKTSLTFVSVLTTSVMLASCSVSGSDSAPNVLERTGTAAEPLWELSVDPIAQPAVADGTALVYVKSPKGVDAMAVSVADGTKLWSMEIHPGIGAPGVELEPALTKSASGANAAVFLQSAPAPTNNGGLTWWTTPVAVDLKTGQEIYRGDVQLVTSRPAACEDEKDLCFTSMALGSSQSVEHRVDLTTGSDLTGRDVNPLTGNFRLVGDGGLYSVVERGSESLARVSGGKKLWAVDVKAIFGTGATTDLGWTFEYSKKLDLYVGTVGSNPTTETDIGKLFKDGFTVDLTSRVSAGFRASTGEVLWTAHGAESWCSSSLGKAATQLEEGRSLPVRCEYTQGSLKLPGGQYENAMAKLVGYDPLTGKAEWQTEPLAVSDIEDLLVPTSGRGDTALIGSPEGRKLINTESGASRAAAAEDVFLCSNPAKYPLPANSPFPASAEGQVGSGGDVAFACDKNGKEAPSLTNGALPDIRTVDGGMAVLASAGKVAGYKIP